MQLNLTRPLLFFDIESTGLSVPDDSIAELSFVKVFPDGEERIKTWRLKPWDYVRNRQRPVSPEASKVNGITDDMLASCPRFCEVVDEIVDWLRDCDLAGFNSAKFDLPLLAEEVERVRLYCNKVIDLDLHAPLMVDVQNIYHAMEPRNLRAAYRFYCGGEDFENAHSAEADTVATLRVLQAQLDRYKEPDAHREQVLHNDVKSLAAFVGRKYYDFDGKLLRGDDGQIYVNFGKHKGRAAREVFDNDPSYFRWIADGSFSLDTKRCFAQLEEQFKRERLAAKYSAGRLF